MKVGSICTGYGGIELGLGVTPAWLAEIDPAAAALLAHHHPDVPNLGDITAVDWTTVEPVDLLVGGIPCQPVSSAGKQHATDDHRWLWPYALDAIKALQPVAFLLENVRNLVSIKKGQVFRGICEDLVTAGYSVRWLTLGACHVGLAHHRHRVFLLATREPDQELRDITRVPTTPCGCSAKALPSPLARDGGQRGNDGDAAYWSTRPIRRAPLGAIAALLPTPRAADAIGGKWEGESREGGPDLRTAAALLPTPTAGKYGTNTSQSAGAATRPSLLQLARMALLPTPRASDTGTAGRAPGNGFRPCLSAALLPVAAMLPTPRAADGSGGRIDLHAAERGAQQPLPTVAKLLPSPRATEGPKGSPQQHGSRGLSDPMLSSAVQPELWGKYAEAVQRHAALYGDPPAPTEPNRNGGPRLAVRFAEWLMNIPAGHVTDVEHNRNNALRLIGNGVSPPQVALAWCLLTGVNEEEYQPMSDNTNMSNPADTEGESVPVVPEPGGVETALGGKSTDYLRAGSPVVAAIEQTLDFHGVGLGRQILREVFGTIERLAIEGSGRKPKNRPGEFAELPLATLRQLAALCRVWSPKDYPPEPVPQLVGAALDEHEALVDAINPAPDPVAMQDGVNALIEHQAAIAGAQPEPVETVEPTAEQLARGQERAEAVAELLASQLGAVPVEQSPNGHGGAELHDPDPWLYAPDAEVRDETGWNATAPTLHDPEPWRADNYVIGPNGLVDDIPF